MKAIFSEETRLAHMLRVEAALAAAQAGLGEIPAAAAKEIGRQASAKTVTVKRVADLERETGHDVMAVVLALTERCNGDAGKYVHLGATSNDILDTATALQLRDVFSILRAGLEGLTAALAALAKKHRGTIMLGRTHGQAAVPITFGLKMAVFAAEVHRHRQRLDQAEPRVVVGKMSGAVGTGAAFGPKAREIQRLVGESLGLPMEEASTQVVSRDRHAEFTALLAAIASSCEKFATEVRNLQRTEIGEVAEAFDRKRQIGSSTMAHKENPITSENVCGLARVVRGFTIPAFEDVALWHERDLTNSSAERILLPHACVLVDDILSKMTKVFSALRVYPTRMRENLDRTNGQVMAEAVMIALTGKGMGRQEAHKVVRDASLAAREKRVHLREVLLKNSAVKSRLTVRELEQALDPARYTGSSKAIVDDVLRGLVPMA